MVSCKGYEGNEGFLGTPYGALVKKQAVCEGYARALKIILDKIGINGLLQNMTGVQDRECYFKECLAYFDGKNLKTFYGLSHGSLATEIRGDNSNKQWSELWSVFIPDNNTKTMSEMSDDERKIRNDNYINPFMKFSKWFSNEGEIHEN